MSSPSFMTLPEELQPLIIKYLSKQDLACCVRVDKSWNALLIPVLWKKLTIHTETAFNRLKTAEGQSALLKYTPFIQELEIRYFGVIKWIVKNLDAEGQPQKNISAWSCLCRDLKSLILSYGIDFNDPLPPPPRAADEASSGYDDLGGRQGFAPFGHPNTASEISGSLVTSTTTVSFSNAPFFVMRPYQPPRTSIEPQEQEMIMYLIKNNPTLRSVHWGIHCVDIPALLSVFSSNYLPKLQNLYMAPRSPRALRNSSDTIPAKVVKRFLENISENIQCLSIQLRVANHNDDDNDNSAAATGDSLEAACNRHDALERFTVDIQPADETLQEFILNNFFQSCSHRIREIESFNNIHLISDRLHQILANIGSPIVSYRSLLAEGDNASDNHLTKLVRRSTIWETIDLAGQGQCGDETATEIAKRCSQLIELNITNCESISSTSFNRILCMAPKLLNLYANYEVDEGYPRNPQLLAEDVIRSPWACKFLKIFDADITGVPRPDVKFRHDLQPVEGPLHSGSVEDSRLIQRRVLAQLGELTELEELRLGQFSMDIGNECNFAIIEETGECRYAHPDFQLTCLEMSLAGGLELLAGLKKLRVLNLSKMMHRVGVPELEWMNANWPNLEILIGLFDDDIGALEPGLRQWLSKHRPSWGVYYCQNELFTRLK
ncbi:hypothetical protein BG004_005323 [Podila humilis]|nr:hypothetical protein BG004_005323 [Podila humilis]